MNRVRQRYKKRRTPMKIFPICFLLFHLFAFVIFGQVPPPPAPARDYFPEKWQESSYPEYGFSIKFPGPLKKTIELAEANSDGIRWVRFSAGSRSFITYSVSVRDAPKPKTERETDSQIIDDSMAARIAKYSENKGLLRNEETIYAGLPAKIYEIESSGKRIRDLVIGRGRLIYVVEVISSSKDGQNALKSKDAYKEIADAFIKSIGFSSPPSIVDLAKSNGQADDKEWKPFESDNDGFRGQWPGVPNVSASEIKTATRVVQQNDYLAKTELITCGMVVQNYNVSYGDKSGLETLSDSWRNGFLRAPGISISSDRSVPFQGTTAREVKAESETVVIIARSFFAQGRFYSASASYKKIYEPLPRIKRTIDSSIDKFFSSIELFKPKALRDAEVEDQQLPDGFFGNVANGKYKNSFFGFEITLPENWIVASSDDNKMLLQFSKDALAVQSEAILAKLKSPEKPIFTVSRKQFGAAGNSSLIIDTNRFATSNINLELSAKMTETTFEKIPNSHTTKLTQKTTLDGRIFYFFEREFSVTNMVIKQRIFIMQHHNYLVTFVLYSVNDADLNVLEATMRSFKFLK